MATTESPASPEVEPPEAHRDAEPRDLRLCPYCSQEVDLEAVTCEWCRQDLTTKEAKRKAQAVHVWTPGRVAVAVLAALALGLFLIGRLEDEKPTQGRPVTVGVTERFAGTESPVAPGPRGPVRPPGWRQVASWSGSGIKQTESFRIVSREWRVHWQTSNEPFAGAGIFQIMVYRADDGGLVTLAANNQGPGKDVSYVRSTPGRFYLTINSGNVDWTVRVEDRR